MTSRQEHYAEALARKNPGLIAQLRVMTQEECGAVLDAIVADIHRDGAAAAARTEAEWIDFARQARDAHRRERFA